MGRKRTIWQVVLKLIKPGVRATLLLAILGVSAGLGCSPAPSQTAWVRSNGGLADQTQLAKAQAALVLLDKTDIELIQVSVINSDAVGAYAWPGGNVYVTRGLVVLLDKRELAAALAHEIGHLIDGRSQNPPSSLRGTAGDHCEIAADAIGARLLAKQGINREVMISMLRKVSCCPSVNPACRNAMQERIERLCR